MSQMPPFAFYKIMSDFSMSLIFATKHPEDIEKLKNDGSYTPKPTWNLPDHRMYDYSIAKRHQWEGHPTEKVICSVCDGMM